MFQKGMVILIAGFSFLYGEVDFSGREKLLSLVNAEWVSQSIYAAAELDLAGSLLQGPKSIRDLSILHRCREDNLYRLMRMLASFGIFHEEEGKVFSNNSASLLLAKDHPDTLRSLILFYSKEMSKSWENAVANLREGTPAFEVSFGEPFFDYLRNNPSKAPLFNAAMKEKSKAVIASCLKSFNFGRFLSIYDIGGGQGSFLNAILNSYPKMEGVLYELPGVIESAQTLFKGKNERCSFISGDFFKSIPQGGDAYLLKSVIHDWDDEDALKILDRCKRAMTPEATLLLIEPMVTSINYKEHSKLMDVYMMMITGGKERTKEEFEILLNQSGFSIESITPTETEFYIISARLTKG